MAIDKKVEVKISADASGVAKGVAIAQGSLAKLQTQLGAMESLSSKAFSFSGLAGIGLSASAAAAALVGAVKAAADYGDQLDNMAQRTGVAVEELSKLQYAAQLSDTSSEALGKGLANLSKMMVAAANGAAESGKPFERFGIELRNADGSVRSANDVLMDLADVFSVMPDGAEKTALAMEFFGKKLGTEMIPLLNQGSAGLKAMGDEAERLGLVLNSEQAKAAADFNDNLDRMAQLSKSVAVSIGNALIPAINTFLQKLTDASAAKLSIWQILGVLPKQGEDQATQLKAAVAGLEALKKKRDDLYKRNAGDGGSVDTSSVDAAIAAEEKRVEYLKLQNKRIAGDDQDTANQRQSIAAALAREVARLEQLKAIAAGKASADILKDDKTRTAEQIKEAEKLRGALQSAWDASRKEAKAAADEATKLLEKAAGVRTSALDKATQLRQAGMSDEDKRAANLAQAQDLQAQGSFYAAAAAAAKLDGRSKDFEKYQKSAEQFLTRAEKFAEQSGDADIVEAVGNEQARLIEQQAAAKLAESKALEAQAQAQADILKKLDLDLDALKLKAATVEIKVDITNAEAAIAALQQKMASLGSQQTIAADINSAGLGGFARGGRISGPGSGTSDSILARVSNGEYVVRAAAVSHYGAGLLSAINSLSLPKFASGGPVGSARQGGSTVNLSLDGNRYTMAASQDVAAALTQAVRREALKKGGRR